MEKIKLNLKSVCIFIVVGFVDACYALNYFLDQKDIRYLQETYDYNDVTKY